MPKFAMTILLGLLLAACRPAALVNLNVPQPPPDPPIRPTTTAEEIDTSDWKTYRNEEWGFEFRYPEAWGSVKITSFEPSDFVVGSKWLLRFSNQLRGSTIGVPTPIIEVTTTDFRFFGPTEGRGPAVERIDFSKNVLEIAEILSTPSVISSVVERKDIGDVKGIRLGETSKSLLDGEERYFEYYIYPRYDRPGSKNFLIYGEKEIIDMLGALVSTLEFDR